MMAASGGDGEATAEPERAAAGSPRLRIHHGELTSALGALALLALMFLTKWYGVAGVPDPSAARPAISTAVDGFNGLGVIRWVILATVAAALGSVALHASQRGHGDRTDTSVVIVVMGGLSSVLLVYRVLIALPASSKVIDQKLGALLGLLCALAIALGGRESIREQRTRPRSAKSRRRRRLASGRRAR